MPTPASSKRNLPSLSVIAALLLLGALVAAALWWRRPEPIPPAKAARPRPSATTEPDATTIQDPIVPQRPVHIDMAASPESADWSKARPGFQWSRSAAERGGIEPCASQKVDTSAFEPWSRLGRGQLLVPKRGAIDATGGFVLVIHLHGDEPARRELIESRQPFVLYAITLGGDQSYAPLFAARGLETLVAEVEAALGGSAGRSVRASRVVLSAWSAGFVGIGAALAQPAGRAIDAAILIDGLHAPRSDRAAFEAQLAPFVTYAERATRGDGFMFVSHSSIDPPDFASTTECAHYLVASLGGKPQRVQRADAFGLELVEYFSRGDLHVRGYAGNDKADHCAQLALLRDVYAALGRRWARG